MIQCKKDMFKIAREEYNWKTKSIKRIFKYILTMRIVIITQNEPFLLSLESELFIRKFSKTFRNCSMRCKHDPSPFGRKETFLAKSNQSL